MADYNPYTESFEDEKQTHSLSGKMGRTALLFGLGSSSMLFVAFMLAYMYSKPEWAWTLLSFPKLFLVSAVLLGFSSFTIRQIPKAFKANNSQKLNKMFLYTISLKHSFLYCASYGLGRTYF